MKHKRRWLILSAACLTTAAGAGIAGALWCNGIIRLNHPSLRDYPVRGVDVSAYQGLIDWPVLARQGIAFAYIKATEGSSTRDGRFAYNWAHAADADIKTGAYHFFSFESTADAQAENFMKTVPVRAGALLPAVDVELYGRFRSAPPARKQVDAVLINLLARLEKQYGKAPVLYATEQSYRLYLSGEKAFRPNPVWIRDVFRKPKLSDRRAWAFWQYDACGKLKGYQGSEKKIDLDLFSGGIADFAAFSR